MDLTRDPKLDWALRHREFFPLDINRASKESLLRIPGLGYRTVNRILSIRKFHRLQLADLAKLRIFLNRAKAFIVTDDYNPSLRQLDSVMLETRVVVPAQLSLFQAQTSALSGQL